MRPVVLPHWCCQQRYQLWHASVTNTAGTTDRILRIHIEKLRIPMDKLRIPTNSHRVLRIPIEQLRIPSGKTTFSYIFSYFPMCSYIFQTFSYNSIYFHTFSWIVLPFHSFTCGFLVSYMFPTFSYIFHTFFPTCFIYASASGVDGPPPQVTSQSPDPPAKM